ncbi:RIP metalloprotease RseP [Candidatus Bipolaricaulota sp. J31]
MITLLVFLATILFLIGVHEFGHFLVAKLTRVWVIEFAIGFGPALASWKRGETRYSLRVFPLGGYVRLAGEGFELEEGIPFERTLPGKPPLVRMAVAVAGPIMNLAAAALIAWLGILGFGLPQPQVAGLVPDAPAVEYLRVGDVVLEVGGAPIWDWKAGFPELSQRIQAIAPAPVPFTVLREGKTISFAIPVKYLADEGRYIVGAYFAPRLFTAEITALEPGSPLERAGLWVGDVIVAACRRPVASLTELFVALEEGCRELGVRRDGESVALTLPDLPLEKLFLGVSFRGLPAFYRRPPLGVSFALTGKWYRETFAGFKRAVELLIKRPREAGEMVSGPVGIAGAIGLGVQAGGLWVMFIVALISLNLALFNLIPFPALDGSRILFALVELVTRRPIPRKVEAAIHAVGFLILLGLLLLITMKDIIRLFG